ncbi:MAG: long-chain fatty acid--CoA ligase [Actinomycetia bacterium]|nr:long-chain fatty acid--CoA ligase [Actinomycetes bacterium]
MPVLRALTLPGGDQFVDELRSAWEAGDAVLPIDPRLPEPARWRLIDALRPGLVVEADGTRTVLDGHPTEPGDAVVVATSGTTGDPKGVIHTHDSVRASAETISRYLEVDPAVDRWLACLPLSHIGGLSVVMRGLLTGTPVEVHPGFDADAATDAAHRGATLVSLVPTALQRLDSSLFRVILLGGSALPADRPANTVGTWGMTETGSGVVYERYPLPGVDLREVDGEIQVRAPMLFRGYRAGTETLEPFDDEGWFVTGDMGSVGADGCLSIDGRRGDLIITGGENVWPTPVERIIEADPSVASVAVVGRPDPEWGAAVTAVVVPTDPGAPPTLDQLRALVGEELPPWCAPKHLELVEDLPRTPLGKVQRSRL